MTLFLTSTLLAVATLRSATILLSLTNVFMMTCGIISNNKNKMHIQKYCVQELGINYKTGT